MWIKYKKIAYINTRVKKTHNEGSKGWGQRRARPEPRPMAGSAHLGSEKPDLLVTQATGP